MSWRDQSTYKPSSALVDEEKEFLKIAKKIRDVVKLEDRQAKGESLQTLQLDKIAGKPKLVEELTWYAAKLPGRTEVLEKNPDIMELLPRSTVKDLEKQRADDQRRRERAEIREAEDRKRPEFMCRHEKPIVKVVVSSDSRFLFTCSKDKYVLCWSLQHELLSCLCTFAGHTGAVHSLDITTDLKLVSGGADGILNLWPGEACHWKKGKHVVPPTTTFDHGGIIKVLRWCPFDGPDSRRLVSASDKLVKSPPKIAVWRLTDDNRFEQELCQERLPTKANDVQWAGGARTKLISAHDNGYVGVWLAEAPGDLLKTLKLHDGPVTSLFITGGTLLTASHDSTAAAVDITTKDMNTLATYRANRPLRAVTCSPDFEAGKVGSIVVAGGRAERDITTSKDLVADEFEGTILDAESGEWLASGKGHIGPVHYLLPLPEAGPNGCFATVSEDGCMRIHDFTDGRCLFADTPMG